MSEQLVCFDPTNNTLAPTHPDGPIIQVSYVAEAKEPLVCYDQEDFVALVSQHEVPVQHSYTPELAVMGVGMAALLLSARALRRLGNR